jgi:hypothetical protein
MRALVFVALAFLQNPSVQDALPSRDRKSTDSPSWKIQYHFDKDRESFSLEDIMFVSRDRGIAVGTLDRENKKKPEGLVLVTRDGGAHWNPVSLSEPAGDIFVVNDSIAFLATATGIWKSDEFGLTWRKIKNQNGVVGLYFLDEQHGWALGEQKLFIETTDGGKTWTDVPAAAEVKSNPDYTVYRWMQFITPTRGTAGGTSIPPRPSDRHGRLPNWVDPEDAAKRRQWPTLSIGLDTDDGGRTWKSQTAPLFGIPVRLSFGSETRGLGLIRFENAFDYPSEVYQIWPKTGKSVRAYREKNRSVTDIGWLTPDRAILVAIEPQGSPLVSLPGRVHVLESSDLENWTEMPVNWKAYAKDAVLASAGGRAWIATDTGMILSLEP